MMGRVLVWRHDRYNRMKMGAKASREVCRTDNHRSWWPIYRPYGNGSLAQPELGVGGFTTD